MLELLNEILFRSDRSETLGVCTLVRTSGSTPQKAGAMMLVLADGTTRGTIGGGCVEAEVRTQALRFISSDSGRLLRFKLDHDLGWDDGLVCGGVMEVAVQVVGAPNQADPFRRARDQLEQGIFADLCIATPDENGALIARSVRLSPAPTLVIAGAGHVGASLAAVAGQMDFRIVVIDDRPDLASADRFPGAMVRIGPVEVELGKIPFDRPTYIVIVTRGHRRDALALAAVVQSKAQYIGLIGSKRKILRIFAELREQGVSAEQLSRVHAPIGLSIGAVTPAEIAVSIAAELIAVRRKNDQPITSMQLTPAQISRL